MFRRDGRYRARLFSPVWHYRHFVSFIQTICLSLFNVGGWPPLSRNHSTDSVDNLIDDDESRFLLPLLQQNGSATSLTVSPEERRRLEENYYQAHSTFNDGHDEVDEVTNVTTTNDREILVRIDKPKSYGTLTSQIIINERLDYMWKNIDVFGEVTTPTEIPVRRKLLDRIKSCCVRGKKSAIPRKHLLKNGE